MFFLKYRINLVFIGLFLQSTNFVYGQEVTFSDITSEINILDVGVTGDNIFGNGVSAADFDNDGDIDFFVGTEAGSPNRLYRNDGGNHFLDIADQVGLTSIEGNKGALWIDYDGDHLLDLLTVGRNRDREQITIALYKQTANGKFIDATISSGLDNYTVTTSRNSLGGVAAADINNDGFLDILVSIFNSTMVLFINNGDGTFSNISESSNIGLSTKQRWQPMFYDFNHDGWIDFYCNVDFAANEMWLNNGDNTFNEVGESTSSDSAFNEMGLTIGDYDNDGDMDIYATNITVVRSRVISHNVLLKNNESSSGLLEFTEVATSLNIGASGWDWGTTFFDANNDGLLDLGATNGWVRDSWEHDYSKFWLNNGDGTFQDNSLISGFNDNLMATTLIAFDSDRDGDLDLAQTLKPDSTMGNTYKPVRLYRNELSETSNPGNYLVVKPRMNETNHFSIGAIVKITCNGITCMRLITAGTSYYGQEPAEAFFGLSNTTIVDELRIEWPDNTVTVLNDVSANQVLTVTNENSSIEDRDSVEVFGCIDPNSCSYNPRATVSDGSCEYFPSNQIFGNNESGLNRTETYSYDLNSGLQANWIIEGGELLSGQGTGTITVRWHLNETGKVIVEFDNVCRGLSVELEVSLNINNVPDNVSIARIWNEALLQAIREDFARPNVHSRNLFHSSVTLYDIWAIYNDKAMPYLIGNTVNNFEITLEDFIPLEDTEESTKKAMSYAMYRLLTHRFENSPGAEKVLERFDLIMNQFGYDTNFTSISYQSGNAAELGNYIGQMMINYGNFDGSREFADYNSAYYEPVNPSLVLDLSGENTGIIDPNRWQPLTFDTFIDQSGNLIPGSTPEFLGPEWGNVLPFALSEEDISIFQRDGNTFQVYNDPGIPPQLSLGTQNESSELYKWNFSLVSLWSSHLDPNDNVLWDISPKSIGNIDISLYPNSFSDYSNFYKQFEGGDISLGHNINPATGEAYQTQMVPRADYARVLAEFWADGPDSETPPGHWFTILNYVNDHELFERKFNGQGESLDPLEWDVKAYFILGGAMHDSAVTAWGIKGWYDYIRPISAIRYMSELGQSTNENLSNYNSAGIPLIDGYIEVVEDGDDLSGSNNENIGKIKVYAWKGHDFINNATIDVAGVGWILAENWWPYQRPSFVTPPFAGFVSGHSTFSRAAAEVLTLITGNEFFPGGIGEFVAKKDEFLVFEKGPSVDVVLQWATYRDASDQTSLSRIWGGIHPPADDILGRMIGEKIGIGAYNFAVPYFNSDIDVVVETDESLIFPSPIINKQVNISNTSETDKFDMFDIVGRKVEIIDVNFNKLSRITVLKFTQTISSGLYMLRVNDESTMVIIN